MAKIMLVEDDNNLREIYEARLLAEGYEIVSAHDGEEALALAVKEKPDLIISDVMMPKISGFDMLDILRTTPEIKDTKVIMMTALSQAEDKDRADKLGADRYLVKSQVTLEDVAKIAREVLETAGSSSSTSTPTPDPAPGPEPAATQPAVNPTPVINIPVTVDSSSSVAPAPDTQTTTTQAPTIGDQTSPTSDPVVVTPTVTAPPAGPSTTADSNSQSINGKTTIDPLNTTQPKVDLNELVAKEEAKSASEPKPAPAPGEDPNLIAL